MPDSHFTNFRYRADSGVTGMRPASKQALGTIFYRGACIGAGVITLCVVSGILINMGHENGAAIVRTLTVAAVAWGAGRTALHFFS